MRYWKGETEEESTPDNKNVMIFRFFSLHPESLKSLLRWQSLEKG